MLRNLRKLRLTLRLGTPTCIEVFTAIVDAMVYQSKLS